MHRTPLATLGLTAALCAQAPTVVSTTPSTNGAMGPFDQIEVRFAAPIAPATVDGFSVSVFGRSTGAVPGTVTVDATQTAIRFQPTVPLFVGDAVRISLAATITSAQGTPLAGGHHFDAVVRTPPGSGTFQLSDQLALKLTNEAPIRTYGVHGGDVDRDGSPDITAINEDSHDIRVFKNGGCGNPGAMTTVQDGQNRPSPHASADFDRDGWIDLVTGDYAFGNVSVFMNDGQGNYLPPLSLTSNGYVRSVDTGDFDGDGYPDLAAGTRAATQVWLNDGNGGFLPPASFGAVGASEINVIDADEDGHLDIVGARFTPGDLWVLIGNGDGTFTPNATFVSVGGSPWASATTDVNGDGHADVVYACRFPDSCRWFFGDGAGGFTVGGAVATPGFPLSIRLGDLDGDGDADAVLSRFVAADFAILRNHGAGYVGGIVSLPAILAGSCTTLVDFDRDGDLDILGVDELEDVCMFYEQDGPTVPGIQPATCSAAVRINQRGAGDGFGSRPPVPVRVGSSMALGLSGSPNNFGMLIAGTPTNTPYQSIWGPISLDLGWPTVWLAAAPLDGLGELRTSLVLPAWVPPGFSLCVQGAVLELDATSLGNPVRFVAVP